MTRTGRIALAALISGTIVMAGLLYLLAFPVDLSRFHSSIESMIGSRVGREIRIKKIVLKALPSPDLTLDGVEAFQKGEEMLRAEQLRVQVSLWPLLLRKTVIERLELKGASLFIKRDREGRINIEDLLEFKTDKEKGRAAVNSLYVQGSALKVLDETSSTPAYFDITDINGYLYRAPGGFAYGAGGRLKPSTMITFTGTGNPAGTEIEGSGNIEALNIGVFNPYFKKARGSSMEATANAAFSYTFGRKAEIKSVVMYKKLKADFPAVFTGPMFSNAGSAILDAVWGEKKSIRLSDVRIALPDFSLRGSFSVDVAGGKESFTLRASSTPIPLKTFKGLIPVKVIADGAASVARDFTPLDGDVTVMDFTLSGPFEELMDGTVFGKPERFRVTTLLNGLSFRYRGIKETCTDFTGSVGLSNGTISIPKLYGRCDKEVLEDLNAELRELTGPLVYRASVKASLDAAETIVAAGDILKSDKTGAGAILGKIRAAGEADLDLDLSGSLKDKAATRYSGAAELRVSSLSYDGFAGSFKSVFADIGFDNKRITVNEARGFEGDSDFRITGFIDDYLKTPSFDISAEGELTGNTVEKFLPPKVAGKLSVDGKMIIKASGSGSRDSFAAAAYLDTTGAAVEYKNVIKKAPDYTLSLEGYIVLKGNELDVKRADLNFGGSSVALAGNFLVDRPVYSYVAQSKELRIADFDNISPFLISEYESTGLISFRIGSAKKSVEANPVYQVVALVKDGGFKTTLIAKPVKSINAAMMMDGNRANIKINGMEAGETSLSGTIDIPDVAGRVVNFNFTSPRLNTDDLVPRETVTAKAKAGADARAYDNGEDSGLPVTGSGEITVNEGIAWGHPFTGFKTRVDLTAKAAVLAPVTLTIDGGRVEGGLTYFKDTKEPLLFETDFRLEDIELETMFKSLGVKSKVLTGRLEGVVKLAWRRAAEPFSAGLSGSAALRSKKGKLWKGTILTKIFSIVNILSIDELFKEGLPYRTLSGDFSLDHGIILTENMAFDSDSLRMSAVGELTVPERKIDAVLAISPFVTIDKIISKIPLAGWIITGKDKSVVSMYFGVDGPLSDPDIYPKPITGLEKGVLGIFKRLLETPERIFRQGKEALP
ncbi:MAG: AsmA-like C-terminal domain-containing protein [Deltaproteobacteria bacterium]|nr:AsmA-like C-terminal domain-containing protein [Deltaproteobacteria bacterium]